MSDNFSIDSVSFKLRDYVRPEQKEVEVTVEFDCEGGVNVSFDTDKGTAFDKDEFDEIVNKIESVVKLVYPNEKMYFILNGHVK